MATHRATGIWTALAATLVLGSAGIAAAAGQQEVEQRVTESRYFADDGRSQAQPNRVSTDTLDTAKNSERRSASATAGDSGDGVRAETPNTDFWFWYADVELFADDDRDGYYHGIDLLFDADTWYASAEVYAVVYLSLEGGPWIEYAVTEDFTIFGASSDDEYVIVTELLDGFPRGDYDVLIELFDAWDGTFVADFGPNDSAELGFLPLEDAGRDTPVVSPRPVVVNRGGGGGTDPVTILALALVVAGCGVLRRRNRPAAVAP